MYEIEKLYTDSHCRRFIKIKNGGTFQVNNTYIFRELIKKKKGNQKIDLDEFKEYLWDFQGDLVEK